MKTLFRYLRRVFARRQVEVAGPQYSDVIISTARVIHHRDGSISFDPPLIIPGKSAVEISLGADEAQIITRPLTDAEALQRQADASPNPAGGKTC